MLRGTWSSSMTSARRSAAHPPKRPARRRPPAHDRRRSLAHRRVEFGGAAKPDLVVAEALRIVGRAEPEVEKRPRPLRQVCRGCHRASSAGMSALGADGPGGWYAAQLAKPGGNASRQRESRKLIIGIRFFLEDVGPCQFIDLALEGGAPIVAAIDAARQLHKPPVKTLVALRPPQIVLDIPQFPIDRRQFAAQHLQFREAGRHRAGAPPPAIRARDARCPAFAGR